MHEFCGIFGFDRAAVQKSDSLGGRAKTLPERFHHRLMHLGDLGGRGVRPVPIAQIGS